MTRSATQAFGAHVAALTNRDMAAILDDYHDDAIFITTGGAVGGRSGIENFYTQALGALPDLEVKATSTTYGPDALLLVWTGTSSAGTIKDGIDTFFFEDGKSGFRLPSPSRPTTAFSVPLAWASPTGWSPLNQV